MGSRVIVRGRDRRGRIEGILVVADPIDWGTYPYGVLGRGYLIRMGLDWKELAGLGGCV